MASYLFAGFATLFAGLLTAVIFFANQMKTSGEFIGRNFIALAWMVVCVLWLLATWPAHAHDHDRPGLSGWYSGLRSPAGSPCCDGPGVDATHLSDVDWESRGGHYRARIDGEWIDVPDDAVLPGPNLDGRTLVWPTWSNGKRAVRCFIPGSMT